jgi:hypothetical protein
MRELPDGFAPRRSQNGVQRESHEDHYRVVPAPKRWELAMADRSSNVLTDLADRRNAVRVLGAASTAILAAVGFGRMTGEARGEGKAKTDRNQRTKRTRHMDSANRPADRSDEPAGSVSDDAAAALMKNDVVTAQRKKRRFASQQVKGETSAPLAADGAGVFSRAFCPGGKGRLLGGGFFIDGTSEQLVNVLVGEAAPDSGAGSFVAVLRGTSGSGRTAGATIQAFAICKA